MKFKFLSLVQKSLLCSNLSQAKTLQFSLAFLSVILIPTHQQILLVMPSKYIQNLSCSSLHFYRMDNLPSSCTRSLPQNSVAHVSLPSYLHPYRSFSIALLLNPPVVLCLTLIPHCGFLTLLAQRQPELIFQSLDGTPCSTLNTSVSLLFFKLHKHASI